jgi:group I intron endonuclease
LYSVYEITNKINGKKYIGITSRSVKERFEEHLSRARCDARNSRLYMAMRKYGYENFTVKLLIQTSGENEVRELEAEFIVNNDSYENGYNCNLGGHGNLKVPYEIREKISKAQKGKIISEESRKKMSQAKLGDKSCAKHFGRYTKKGADNPKSKYFNIQFPDGHTETIKGLRAF